MPCHLHMHKSCVMLDFMYVRKKTTKKNPNTYVQLVEGHWVDGKARQRVIKHIGTASNQVELDGIVDIANEVKALYGQRYSELDIDKYLERELSKLKGAKTQVLNCREIKRINTGITDIYGKMYDEIGLLDVIKQKSNYQQILRDIVIGRIASPGSKKYTCEFLESFFDIKYSLNSIYRAMDQLDKNALEKIQLQIATQTKKELNGVIKVLFFDATSLYFESFSDDELKNLGYSKDGKFNQPQLILTLLVTDEGLPLGYQLFPGNTYEGHTLIRAMQYWKKQYPGNQFVLVADSGLLNDINLTYLDSEEIDYIVCARIKNLPKKDKEKILAAKECQNNKEEYFIELKYKSRKLVVSYKETRAKKDRFDRDKAVSRLKKKLKSSKSPANLISNYGYKKYISVDAQSHVELNQEKVSVDEQWDGLHGLITNMDDKLPAEIYSKYSGLWQIEDAFRINKSDLKIRPIFHWTPNRIKSHIGISYIAYSCYKFVEHRVNKNGLKISHRQIKKLLLETQASILEDVNTKDKFFMPSNVETETKIIYKTMDVQPQDAAYCCTLSRAS